MPVWASTTAPIARCRPHWPNPERRRLTIYEGIEHDSWTQTYDGSAGHDIYAWLGQFRRTAGG